MSQTREQLFPLDLAYVSVAAESNSHPAETPHNVTLERIPWPGLVVLRILDRDSLWDRIGLERVLFQTEHGDSIQTFTTT
jgi:hypothetical protein